MAETTLPTNSRVVKYERKFFSEYIRANRFSKYTGADESAIIQINENSAKAPSEQINFTLVNRLAGSGVTGTSTLEGNEEALGLRNFRITLDRTRHAVLHDKLHEQFSSIDLVESKRSVLMDWWKENIRDRIITALGSISTDGSTHVAYASATAGNKNTWNANNSDRVLYGNSTANYNATHSSALANCDTTNDTFTAANLQVLKDVAKSANPKIKPIKVRDEEEYYVVFCGTRLFRTLQTSLQSINIGAWSREADYKDNPIYTGGDLVYDGMIIREIPEIANLGTVGASSANVGVAYLCGAQAIGYAIAQRSKMIENERDYGAKVGAGIQMIDGIAKMYFGSGATDTTTPKQNGVATGFFAYV